MALRWFRQHPNATKWIFIGLTGFVMLTFPITDALVPNSRPDAELLGTFRTFGGETVEVDSDHYHEFSQKFARCFGVRNIRDEDVWQMLMLDKLAQEAGVSVSSEMLADFMKARGITNQQTYQSVLAGVRMTAADYEDFSRRVMRAKLYQGLMTEPDVLSSKEVFERFQQDNELFDVAFVAFSESEQAAKLSADSQTTEQLKQFYETELDALTKRNEFSTPEKYGLDAALLNADTASIDAMKAALPEDERAVEDSDVEDFYEDNKDKRFTVPADPAASAPAEGAEAPAATAPAEQKFQPLADVRDAIVRELLVERVLEAATEDYRKQQGERAMKKAEAEQKKAEGGTPDAPAPADEEDLLAVIAKKFGMEVVTFGEPRARDELKALERIGSEDLAGRVTFLGLDMVTTLETTEVQRDGALIRMKSKVEPTALPFEEVIEKLKPAWVKQTAKKQAQEAADQFRKDVKAAARASCEAEVAKVEQEAKDSADKIAAEQSITDEAKKKEIADTELRSRQARIDAIMEPFEGEAFTKVAAEQGREVKTTGEVRKTYRSTMMFADEPASPEKFLRGDFQLANLPAGRVAGPLRDETSGMFLVAKVLTRRFPTFAEMRPSDKQRAEQPFRNQWMMRPYQSPESLPLSYSDLANKLELKLVDRNADSPKQ